MRIPVFCFLYVLLISPSILFAQQKPGDLAADVVYIDADELGPFRQGFAIIKKGIATAIIDKNGSFLIPYQRDFVIGITESRKGHLNVVDTLGTSGPDGFVNGFCAFFDKIKKKHGFYNRKGKLIYTDYNIYDNFNKNGYAPLWGGGYIDTLGKKVQIKNIAPGKETDPTKLTPVETEDFYGKKRWGFADAKGNLVIPATYEEKPGSFSEGLSLTSIINKDKPWEKNYEYIDRSGTVKIKVSKGNPSAWPYNAEVPLREPGTFVHGLSYWSTGYGFDDETGFWVTTSGEELSYSQLLHKFSANFSLINVQFDNIYEHYICFKGRFNDNVKTYGYAYINVLTGESLEGPFVDVRFDEESGLALQNVTYYSNNRNPIPINGYINKSGLFTIVKKQ